MDFISNKKVQIDLMLKTIGVASIEELFAAIPSHIKLEAPLTDDGLSEYEGIQHVKYLASKNTFLSFESYLGGGAYEHHIPALVQAVCSKSEFLTSYTPYQAEASQGMLQAIFEFQSAICALTGMDAANASLYDGASACGEALLMCLRIHKDRSKILVAETLHPHYRSVVAQYLTSHNIEQLTIPMTSEGVLDHKFLKAHLDASVAAVILQSPNFLGLMENCREVAAMAKASKTLIIQCADLISYGIYASAAENHVDIAIGDCQSLGLGLSFGGPYAGYIAARSELVRQIPGRIVGETVDSQGERGFVLTLQAREQHIRREKATSNICTNQALAALAVLVTILWYGKEGIPKLALSNFKRAGYLKDLLCKIPGIKGLSEKPFFNEFAIQFNKPAEEVLAYFRKVGIEPGLDLGRYYPHLKGYLLVAVTETKNKDQLDRYLATAKALMEVS